MRCFLVWNALPPEPPCIGEALVSVLFDLLVCDATWGTCPSGSSPCNPLIGQLLTLVPFYVVTSPSGGIVRVQCTKAAHERANFAQIMEHISLKTLQVSYICCPLCSRMLFYLTEYNSRTLSALIPSSATFWLCDLNWVTHPLWTCCLLNNIIIIICGVIVKTRDNAYILPDSWEVPSKWQAAFFSTRW